jgi:hypothetical protein
MMVVLILSPIQFGVIDIQHKDNHQTVAFLMDFRGTSQQGF